MQQHPADFRAVLYIIEGEMDDSPAHSAQECITVKRVTEFLPVHILHMTLVTVTLQTEFSVGGEKGNIQKL